MFAQSAAKGITVATFTVRQGHKYRATISLGLLEGLAGNDVIADRLRDAGFVDVAVEGSGSTRRAVGLWPHNASAELPSQITAVTEIEVA
jgi:hypothetical protein